MSKKHRNGPEKLNEKQVRAAVLETALAMSRSGLSPLRSGNLSCRFEDGMLITPTGMIYEDMGPADIVYVTAEGEVPGKQRQKPSSEWQFHLAAYAARPDRNAVVHSHSTYATALASARKPIPAFHYMVAVAGGTDIPVVPYATFGSNELATYVAGGLASRDACLMANHGQLAIGATLGAAFELAQEVEILAQQYVTVLALGGPQILSDIEINAALERFKTYGPRSQK